MSVLARFFLTFLKGLWMHSYEILKRDPPFLFEKCYLSAKADVRGFVEWYDVISLSVLLLTMTFDQLVQDIL